MSLFQSAFTLKFRLLEYILNLNITQNNWKDKGQRNKKI